MGGRVVVSVGPVKATNPVVWKAYPRQMGDRLSHILDSTQGNARVSQQEYFDMSVFGIK